MTIFRPLTSARNYATIADRKSKFGGVISEYVFRNNRARKSIRTLMFYQGSYAQRLAQKTRLSAGYALDGFVGGKSFCPFPASCFAAFSRELVFNPRFRAARLLRQRKKKEHQSAPLRWRRRRDSNSCYLYGTTPLAGELYFCLSTQNIGRIPILIHSI